MQPSQEDAFITREVQTTPIHPPTHPQSQRAVNQSDEPSASTIHTIAYDSSNAHICITLKPQTRPRPALLCPPGPVPAPARLPRSPPRWGQHVQQQEAPRGSAPHSPAPPRTPPRTLGRRCRRSALPLPAASGQRRPGLCGVRCGAAGSALSCWSGDRSQT